MGTVDSPNGTVELTIEDNIAELRSTNPERQNCVSFNFVDDLFHHISHLEEQKDEIYAITITHEGDVFCAGFDLDVIANEDEETRNELTTRYHACQDWLVNVDIPVVTGARGPAVAMGAGYLMAGDIVVIGSEFQIWWSEINAGLFPYRMGAGFIERFGVRRAAELTFLGTEAKLDAQECRELGIANRIRDPDDVDAEVRDIGNTLAEHEREYGYMLDGYEVFNVAKRQHRNKTNAGVELGNWMSTYDEWFSDREPLTGGRGDPREE